MLCLHTCKHSVWTDVEGRKYTCTSTCYAQSMDWDNLGIVLCKPWIWALCKNPQINEVRKAWINGWYENCLGCLNLGLHSRKCVKHGIKPILPNLTRKRIAKSCRLTIMPTLINASTVYVTLIVYTYRVHPLLEWLRAKELRFFSLAPSWHTGPNLLCGKEGFFTLHWRPHNAL